MNDPIEGDIGNQIRDSRHVVEATDKSPEEKDTEEVQNTTASSISPDQRQSVRNLAVLLLDSRKIVLQDSDGGLTEADQRNEFSRSTLIRAKKVAMALDLKYMYILRIHDWTSMSKASSHAEIEGTYNPLQVIRNRKIREKYKEHPKPLSQKTLPLACNVFSKRNVPGRRPWKMVWLIELDELFYDLTWRTMHWHELKRSTGEIWFPEEKHARNRIHDRLFKESPTPKRRASGSSGDTVPRNSSPHRHRLRRRVKQQAKKFYGSTSSYSSDDSSIAVTKSNDKPETKSRSNSQELWSKSRSNSQELWHLSAESSSKVEDLNVSKVSFRPVEREPPESKESDLGPVPSHVEGPGVLLIAEQNLRYIESGLALKLNYLLKVYPHLVTSVNSKLNHILHEQCHEILRSSVRINDDILPAYENLSEGFNNEVKSLMQVVNDVYAMRTDNLLSTSDRSIGEINTSLSLELRKVNEKLDRLNVSLFSSVVSDALRENDLTINLKSAGDYRALYFCIENFIVIVLRLIWVTVNIYKLFAGALKLLWKLITFLLK